MVDHRVLNVKIENLQTGFISTVECEVCSHLPHRVEKHGDDERLGETQGETLRGDGARDDVPPLEVAGQRLE